MTAIDHEPNISHFALSAQAIDVTQLKQQLNRPDCGAVVTFEGLVRNHNNKQIVTHLHYSAYDSMAVKMGAQIVQRTLEQYDIERGVCVHRIGELAIGDMAIFVGVASHHRDAAFQACRNILEEVKADVPIWKQEFYANQEPLWLSNNG